MPLSIVREDIVKMKTDVIVNAANSDLLAGGGVCGAIFSAAGEKDLQDECNKIGFCAPGKAVSTKAYALPAKRIIHTVGPIWEGGNHNEKETLISCYTSALKLAKDEGFSSISFPLISSGIYGYPKHQAFCTAISAIGDFLESNDMDVYLIVFDSMSFKVGSKLYPKIEQYIDDRYSDYTEYRDKSQLLKCIVCGTDSMEGLSSSAPSLQEYIDHPSESFSDQVLRLIKQSGKTETDIYRKANLDRRLFSKIRSKKTYKPSRSTALALAIALSLDKEETAELLQSAGYALSNASRADLIIEYFIEEEIWDIFKINEALYSFGEQILGA